MKKKIEKFEQLIAWQKARTLTSQIYRVTNQGRFAGDFGLRDQVPAGCRFYYFQFG